MVESIVGIAAACRLMNTNLQREPFLCICNHLIIHKNTAMSFVSNLFQFIIKTVDQKLC